MFEGISEDLLRSGTLKEDAVREIIIAPLIKKLGYLPSGRNKVLYGQRLKHPFLSIGTTKREVVLVPDYILIAEEKFKLVLDAKGTNENIHDRKFIEQAYSYAIHPEVRANYFSLCNGKEIVLYDIFKEEPIFSEKFVNFENNWSEIDRYFGPRFVSRPSLRNFKPDFGIALSKLGIDRDVVLDIPNIRIDLIATLDKNKMALISNCIFSGNTYCATFDFENILLSQILSGIPTKIRHAMENAMQHSPFQAAAQLALEVDLECVIGEKIIGRDEEFIPLIIEKVTASRFKPEALDFDFSESPPGLFQLRKAFILSSN